MHALGEHRTRVRARAARDSLEVVTGIDVVGEIRDRECHGLESEIRGGVTKPLGAARAVERLEEVGLLTLPRVGCQILVYTPEELETVKQQGHYFFVDEILGKGKVLYERGKSICLPTG